MPANPEIQQKAQRLQQQAQSGAPLFDGSEFTELANIIVEAVNAPAPDFEKIGEQLASLGEMVQNVIPDNVDAAEILQPLLESIGDLLGSIGDFSP